MSENNDMSLMHGSEPEIEPELGFDEELYTLVDEEGNEKLFELVDIYAEGEGDDKKVYFALVPHIDPENAAQLLEEEMELVVLRVNDGEDGEDILEPIESDEEYERIANIFIDRLGEDDEDEEDE